MNKPVNYYAKFYAIWCDCIAQGMSCNDARDFAELELTGLLFHNEEKIFV